jgi:HEAT repeat protein
MAEEKKEPEKKEKPEAVPLGETEPIDQLTQPQVPPEKIPQPDWPLEKLIEALMDSNMLIRSNAVNSLAKKGGPEVVGPLVEGLKDPEDVVKSNAMVGLAHLGKDLVQDRMVQAVMEEEDDDVRAGAAWVLGEMIDEKSLDILRKAAEDESPLVRVHAKASLLAYERAQTGAKGEGETEKKE